MDPIYFWIIILFAIVLILDYTEGIFKKKNKNPLFMNEHFDNFNYASQTTGLPQNVTPTIEGNFSPPSLNPVNLAPPWYEENNLIEYVPTSTSAALNISGSNNPYFKNFSTNGVTPPYGKCVSCQLDFDCTNYDYEVDQKNQNVCKKCYNSIYVDNKNFPVYAKANGRPRQCRNLE